MKLLNSSLVILVIAASTLACSVRASRFTWKIMLRVEASPSNRQEVVVRTIAVIEKRLDAVGIHGYDVSQEKPGSDRILVKLSNVPDRERLKGLIVSRGKLELFHVFSAPSPAACQVYATEKAANEVVKTLEIPANYRVLRYTERLGDRPQNKKPWVIVRLPTVIEGSDLRTAEAIPYQYEKDDYMIQFSLNRIGAQRFGAWTGVNISEYIAVALNDEVRSIAFIKSQIYDLGEITGRFTKQAAEDLALILRSGALPAPTEIIAEETLK